MSCAIVILKIYSIRFINLRILCRIVCILLTTLLYSACSRKFRYCHISCCTLSAGLCSNAILQMQHMHLIAPWQAHLNLIQMQFIRNKCISNVTKTRTCLNGWYFPLELPIHLSLLAYGVQDIWHIKP